MHLTRFSDYSLRVLMFAALKNDWFQIDEVAKAYDLSRNHLAKIVRELSNLGYLDSRRGRGGGNRLQLDPAEITLGSLLRKTEGQSSLVECFDPKTNTCKISTCCQLKGILAEAQNAFFDQLDEYSLADLTSGARQDQIRRTLLIPKAS